MARGVDCSWIQLVSHALSLSFKRKNIQRATERERERVCVGKNILLYKSCSLSVHIAKKEKDIHHSLLRTAFLYFHFPARAPSSPPSEPAAAICSVGDAELPLSVHFSYRSPHTQCGGHAGRPSCQGNAFLTFDHDVRAAVSSERKYK